MSRAHPPGVPSIETRGWVRRHGSFTAADGVDLTAVPGACLDVLGPNGAGETTTIEVLEGLLDADGGEVRPPEFLQAAIRSSPSTTSNDALRANTLEERGRSASLGPTIVVAIITLLSLVLALRWSRWR